MRALLCGCVTLFVLALASSASAQTASYQAKYYNAGATQPLQTETFQSTAAVCNQAAPTSTTTVNPTRIVWDDTANVGKVCIYSEATGGPLFSLPIGSSYEGTLTAVNAAGGSTESNRAPFSTLALPPAPTNFKVVR